MFNPIWFQIDKKPSQYQGIKGDIQPPLVGNKKARGLPSTRPINRYAPTPLGKIPSPIFFQQEKIKENQTKKHNQNIYVSILLVFSIIFSGSVLFWKWSENSYNYVSANAQSGQEHLLKAKDALIEKNFNLAVIEFVQAEDSFREAKKTLAPALSLPIDNPAQSAYYLLEAGELISNAGEQTCIGMSPVLDLVLSQEGEKGLDLTAGRFVKEIMIAFSTAEGPLRQAVSDLNQAELNLKKINSTSLDPDIQRAVNQLQDKFPTLKEFLTMGFELSQFLPTMLGNSAEQKYMIVFQNNWELRPTGGFIGGFSVLVLQDAKIKEMYTKNIYDVDGQISDYIEPPKPLESNLAGHSWGTRDANWDPDFPSSASMVEWFYNRAVAESVDGIIAIDPTFIGYVLKLIGQINITYGNQNITVNSDNFVQINEEQERNTPQGTDPRQFLINLSSNLFEKLLSVSKANWPSLLGAIKKGLDEKHLLFYFNNPKAQSFVESRNWAGKIIKNEEKSDFLMINDANINGSKSCQLIKQEVNLDVMVDSGGKIQNKLTIIYQHTGTNVWPSSMVNYYTRVYVPKDSKLISATGNKKALTEISDAHNKTVFSDYLTINPGETISIAYVYELPFTFEEDLNSYQIYVQKQPGTLEPNLRFSMQLPPEYKAVTSPRKIEVTSDNVVWFIDKLNTDQEFEVLLKKQ